MSASQFNFLVHLERQRKFSIQTFGPGARTLGVVQHIRKELHEVLAAPTDIYEWIDVVILALDGAWRSGAEPQQIIDALVAKQAKNESRTWPDWRVSDPNKAIEHVRERDAGRATLAEVAQGMFEAFLQECKRQGSSSTDIKWESLNPAQQALWIAAARRAAIEFVY